MDLQEFRKAHDECRTHAEKSRVCLEFMKDVLSSGGGVKMGDFWEAKRLCAEAFKGELSSVERAAFWKSFTALTDEAKHLKAILDEKAAFSYEQIELAVQGIALDLEKEESIVRSLPSPRFPQGSKLLRENRELYSRLEKRLKFLKALGSRYQALRKEAISTDMRMGQRNKLLKRLGLLGDTIFGRRKQFVEEVSAVFMNDVTRFIEVEFLIAKEKSPFRARRDIQFLQEFAKQLSLSRKVFTECRGALSKCWEALSATLDGKKEVFEEHYISMKKEIESFLTTAPEESSELVRKSDIVSQKLSKAELMPAAYKELTHLLQSGVDEALAKSKQKQDEVAKAAAQRRGALVQALKDVVRKRDIQAALTPLSEEMKGVNLSQSERAECGNLFAEAKEKAMGQAEKKAHKNGDSKLLLELLEKRKSFVEGQKGELSALRKEMESLSFDFEKAMIYRELYEVSKERLVRAQEALGWLTSVCG